MQKELERCEALLNISTNIFLETTSHGIIKYANSHAQNIFGANLIGRNIISFFPGAEAELFLEKIIFAAENNQSGILYLALELRYYKFYFYQYHQNCLICIEDITERRDLSNALAKASQRLDFAEKTAKLGYWELDYEQKKIYWSLEMFRIFGATPAEISPKRNLIRELVFKEDIPIYKNKLRELVHNQKPVEGQLRIRRLDGRMRYCFFKASIITDDGHRKIAGTFQDLTSIIETQIALEKARDLAEDMNRAKSFFLAQASHDLRQPMQALSMFISAMSEEHLNPRQTMLINKIEASADNLKTLLDNLLDLSKLEAGGIQCESINFNIGELLKKIASEYIELAKQRQLSFRFIPHQCIIFSDPVLVERIIRNLLTNAFKYTRSKILLGCKWHKDYIRIIISDNGVGIKAEEQEKIFDEFYQCRDIPDNRLNGAGLGLAIVKRISDIINTKIHFDSIPNQGTCFYFDLPIIRKL